VRTWSFVLLCFWLCSWLWFSWSFSLSYAMPSTPPPPSPPLPAAAASPLTSPQRHQQATCHHEHTGYTMNSPEQHRIPAPPLLPSISAPVAGPSTYNGQTFHHLPPHLAAGLAALPPIPVRPSRCSTSLAPAPQILSSAQLAVAHVMPPPLPPVSYPFYQYGCILIC
jgi:hypothetical protein